MKLIDVNLLLYCNDIGSPRHPQAKAWAEEILRGREPVGLPLPSILGYVRISTTPRLPGSIAVEAAIESIEEWLAQPTVSVVHPGARHWPILKDLIAAGQAAGPLAPDAHVAALAMEHGATLCTNDRDFSRFSGLRVEYPLGEDRPRSISAMR